MKTITQLKRTYVVLALIFCSVFAWSQTIIGKYDFDGTNTMDLIDATSSTNPDGSTAASTTADVSAATESPASTSFAVSGQAWYLNGPVVGGTSPFYESVLTFANMTNLGSDPYKYFKFRLGAWSVGGIANSGIDGNDSCMVSVSTDGGITWSKELVVKGGGANSRWSYDTGKGTAFAVCSGLNIPKIVKTSTGGAIKTVDGYSTVKLLLPANCTQAQLRIRLVATESTERWTVDDVDLESEATLTKINQSITAVPPTMKQLGDPKFVPDFNITSGLPVTLTSSDLNVVTISYDTVKIVGGGTVKLTFSQPGDLYYNAAKDTTVNLVVASAKAILGWDMTTITTTMGALATFNSTFMDPAVATSTLSRGPGITAIKVNKGFNAGGWNYITSVAGDGSIEGTKANALVSGDYFEFTLQVNPNSKVALTALDCMIERKAATSPNAYMWEFSVDNGNSFTQIGSDQAYTDLTAGGKSLPTVDLSSISALQNLTSTTPVIFRHYAWGALAPVSGGVNYSFGSPTTAGTLSLAVRGTVTPLSAIEEHKSNDGIYSQSGKIFVKSGSDCAVFNIQGIKIAEATNGTSGKGISMKKGIYVVKTTNNVQKVVVN